jgi:hypothetical protein
MPDRVDYRGGDARLVLELAPFSLAPEWVASDASPDATPPADVANIRAHAIGSALASVIERGELENGTFDGAADLAAFVRAVSSTFVQYARALVPPIYAPDAPAVRELAAQAALGLTGEDVRIWWAGWLALADAGLEEPAAHGTLQLAQLRLGAHTVRQLVAPHGALFLPRARHGAAWAEFWGAGWRNGAGNAHRALDLAREAGRELLLAEGAPAATVSATRALLLATRPLGITRSGLMWLALACRSADDHEPLTAAAVALSQAAAAAGDPPGAPVGEDRMGAWIAAAAAPSPPTTDPSTPPTRDWSTLPESSSATTPATLVALAGAAALALLS